MSWSFFGYFSNFMLILWHYIFYLSFSMEVYLLGINSSIPYHAYLLVFYGSFHFYNHPFFDYISLNHISA